MPGKMLIVEVDDDKYSSTVEALSKRSYIKILSMDREGRKAFSVCPCCNKKLTKEHSFSINESFVESLVKIAEKMSVSKTVVVINKENPASSVPAMELERSVEVDSQFISRAVSLGLVEQFMDGNRTTYFVTSAGLSFLLAENPASPSTMVTLDGEVIELSGKLMIGDVKFKDQVKGSKILIYAARAVESMPESVRNFVRNGQMDLI